MCGIAGIINAKQSNIKIMKQMLYTMIHRGPDSEGIVYVQGEDVLLGHRRLSILDLSESGKQPMVSVDGRYILVFNGEIYNFKELKEDLKQKNVTFRSNTDTEVLLNCFVEFGVEKTLNIINGMFAIGLYDKKLKKLVLARDRGGEKPLYYGWLDGQFVFASELKAIKAADVNKSLNISMNAAKAFLQYSFVPQPLTIYDNIYKLIQGQYLTLQFPFDRVNTIQTYWEYREEKESISLDYLEAKSELRRLLYKAVGRQMVTDVPYGAFLSGGIDSSLISAIMQDISEEPIKTFTIGFDLPGFNEAEYAKKIAKELGCIHTEKYFGKNELMQFIPRMADIYDEPLADISQLAMCLLVKTAKENVTVCLSGDCGDELFLGYGCYTGYPQKRKYFPRGVNRFVGKILSDLKFIDKRFYRKGKEIELLYGKEFWENYQKSIWTQEWMDNYQSDKEYMDMRMLLISNEESFVQQIEKWDFYTTMSDMILTKVDRAAMSVSLETRVPFLDKEIIEFSSRLPTEYLIKYGKQKYILQDMLSDYIPKELYERPKQGFAVPMHIFLRNELKDWADSYIFEDDFYRDFFFLNKKAIQNQWTGFQRSNLRSGMSEFWRICILGQWWRRWK